MVNDKKFEYYGYYGGSLKNPIFRGGWVTKSQYIGRSCLKRGLGQFADLRACLAKKRG